MEKDKALQIVKIIGHEFRLDIDILTDVLLHPEIRDRKIVVVSVAGAFRKGKSFLLGFFLRYLYAQYEEKDITNWIEKGGDLRKGFSWRNGPERETTGILMWSKVFLYENDNEKIAIILLDTQGVYDNQSTAKDCAFIFALSTLISSVQVYNLSQNIQENDLQHLQLFAEYGKLALENSDCKPFQKLQFLIRDWQYNFKHKYGAEGGKELLDNCLEITETQHEELKSVRKHIRTSFNEIDCFLMPHPGLTVAQEESFRGQLEDIDKTFKQYLNELVPLLLAPKHLIPKKINGKQIQSRDLIPFFSAYVEMLGGDKLPEPATIVNATAEANHMIALSEASDYYIREMEKLSNSQVLVREDGFKRKHEEFAKKSMEKFDSSKKMGCEEITAKYRTNLQNQINNLFIFYNNCNLNNIARFEAEVKVKNLIGIESSQKYYENKMNELFVQHNYLEDDAFGREEKDILSATLKYFSTFKTDEDTDFVNQETKLIQSLEMSYKIYERRNKDNRTIAEKAEEGEQVKVMNSSKAIYENGMRQGFSQNGFISSVALDNNHIQLKKKAIDEYTYNSKKESKFFEQYLNRLNSDISFLFMVITNENRQKTEIYESKMNSANLYAVRQGVELYQEKCKTLFQERGHYISLNEMQTKHNTFKKEAENKFYSLASKNGSNYESCENSFNKEIDSTYKLYGQIRRDYVPEQKSSGCTIL